MKYKAIATISFAVITLCSNLIFAAETTAGLPSREQPSYTSTHLQNAENQRSMDKSALWDLIDQNVIDFSNITAADMVGKPVRTLSDLEEASTHIVSGHFTGSSREDLDIAGGMIFYGCTITPFAVSRVFKGDIAPGEMIEIGEEYYTDKYNGVCYFSNALPSRPDKEYLFFLTKTPETKKHFAGIYAPVEWENGRYPVVNASAKSVSVASIPNRDLELGGGDTSTYKDLYEEVINSYMK